MTKHFYTLLFLITLATSFVVANETHGSGEEEHEESGHGKHEESEKSNIGPEKGIVEYSERNGFKLSPEALKNFDLKSKLLTGEGPWIISKGSRVLTGEEINLFRIRKGFFKRIDFQTLKTSGDDLTVDSDDMREGDQIVSSGLGFLRIAELAATGGVADGHSH